MVINSRARTLRTSFRIRVTAFDEARASRRAKASDAQIPAGHWRRRRGLEKFILAAGQTESDRGRCVLGNTAYAASDFVQAVEADLLAVRCATVGIGKKIAGADRWVTDVIPCNLWVIRFFGNFDSVMNAGPPLQQFGPAHLCVIILTLSLPVFFGDRFPSHEIGPASIAYPLSLAASDRNYIGYVVYRWQHGYMYGVKCCRCSVAIGR